MERMPTTVACSRCGSDLEPDVVNDHVTMEGIVICGKCRDDAARNIVPEEIKLIAGPSIPLRELGKFWIMPLAPGGKSPQELWEGSDRECVIDALLDFMYDLQK